MLEETLPGSGALGDFTREWCLRRIYQGVLLEETLPGMVLDETLPGSGA